MHQPTLRVLRVLNQTAKQQSFRLAEISRELDIPKSTLLPILQTLCDQQFLRQNPDGSYSAGTALFYLGAAFTNRFPLLRYVEEELKQLVDELDETCYFGALDGGNVLYLSKQECNHALRVLIEAGCSLPAYATSLGKALLLDHTEQQLLALYPEGLQALTEATITDPSTLAKQLRQAQNTGFTSENGESTKDICCFAVPVRKNGRITAAVSVAIPVYRHRPEQEGRIIAALQTHAGQLGLLLEQTDAHFGNLF